MSEATINTKQIKSMLNKKKRMKFFLSVCASCGLCADSCFLYRNNREPEYMPSFKAINSLGKMFKKKGKVDKDMLDDMKKLIWGNCVLCRRCYCPFGIEIHSMISWARTICRTQGVCENYERGAMGV